VFQEKERAYYDYELEKSHLKMKEFLTAQEIKEIALIFRRIIM